MIKVTDSNNFTLMENPPTMRSVLHNYQRQGLTWMLFREGFIKEDGLLINKINKERKLNPMWEEQLMMDGTLLYFNNFTGGLTTEFKNIKPSLGGILADEMGLGENNII
jgi:SNF2 family DNA or RNA helicase